MTTSSQDVLALIDAGFSGVERDEGCTIHQAQLADESLFREISENERMAARARGH